MSKRVLPCADNDLLRIECGDFPDHSILHHIVFDNLPVSKHIAELELNGNPLGEEQFHQLKCSNQCHNHSQKRSAEAKRHCYQRLPRETTLCGHGPNGAIWEAALHEWAAFSMDCRGEHLCNHKWARWSLHPLRAYDSPQGYKCRIPGAWGGWKPSALSYYRWIRTMVISIATIPFVRMRTSGSLH